MCSSLCELSLQARTLDLLRQLDVKQQELEHVNMVIQSKEQELLRTCEEHASKMQAVEDVAASLQQVRNLALPTETLCN